MLLNCYTTVSTATFWCVYHAILRTIPVLAVNDYPLYNATQGYKTYPTPYLSLRYDLRESFNFTQTRDGASLWDRMLDIKALDKLIAEY